MTNEALERRHLAVGWLVVSIFITLGIALEVLHALKTGYLLDVQNETRRQMWTLAHAHGTLLGLMNLGFAFSITRLPSWPLRSLRVASSALLAATLMIPAGFFLGGVSIYSGDPGLGVLLVPPGGLLLLVAAYKATQAAFSELRSVGGS